MNNYAKILYTGVSFPCKECTKRTLGCHDTCEEYKQAKGKADNVRAEKKKAQALDMPFRKEESYRARLKTRGLL